MLNGAINCENTPKYWCDSNPLQTRLFEAVSLLAPEAERFFIIAVRDHLKYVEDDQLLGRCRQFIREEGQHSHEHRVFNKRLQDQDIDLDQVLAPTRKLYQWGTKLSPQWRLSLTAAGEHLSAIISEFFLRHHHELNWSNSDIRELYIQHANEEIGHCSDAYDLMRGYSSVGYLRRVFSLWLISFAALFCILQVTNRLLSQDPALRRPRIWLVGLGMLLVPSSLSKATELLHDYLRYLLPAFRPGTLNPTA